MKINVERRALERALETGGQMAGRNRALPVLDNVKITFKGGRMRVTSFSGSAGVSAPLEVLSGDGDTVFCTDPKRLLQAVKLMDGDVVSLVVDTDKSSMTLEHDSGHITLPVAGAEDFPDFGREETEKEAHIPGQVLSEWARISEKFASRDELRPVLSGMLLYGEGGDIGFCASDSRILVTDSAACGGDNDFSVIVPAVAFSPLQKCFKSAESVRMLISGKGVVFSSGGVSLYCQLLSGRYPNFRSILPSRCSGTMSVDKDAILSAVRRLMVSADSSTHMMVMECGGDAVSMRSADTSAGCATEERLPCACPGDVKVGLNGEFFAVAIDSVQGGQVNIGIESPKKPVLLTGDTQSRRSTVIMPLAI